MFLRDADEERKTVQQEKIKVCNKETSGKSLKSDERMKFLSACLSNYDDVLSGAAHSTLFFIFLKVS